MKLVQMPFLAAILVCVVAASRISYGQTPNAIAHSDIYAVSISMDDSKSAYASMSPSVALVIKNISDKSISRDDCSSEARVWVQGEHGEPPTTYRGRFNTSRLLPGEPDLMCTLNMSWRLAPGESTTKHYLLKDLYDLHEPGKYSVYLEFPTTEGLVRTNTVRFEVLKENASQK